jgi:hypothetical protein
MRNDITKSGSFQIANNFEGWTDDVAGDDKPENAGLIQGALLKFSNEGRWATRDGDELSRNLELVAVDVARVVQKWHDQKPVETKVLEPGEPFPDIDELNDGVPREEWEEDLNGNPRGPYQAQHILYLLDLSTMERFTYTTATFGGRKAIRDLRDKLIWMQRLRGANVYPVVTLSDTFMNTKWGGRQRPDFKIVRWVRLGGEEGAGSVLALEPPTSPTTPPTAATAKPVDLPLSEVAEPTLKEELNDDLPDFSEPAERRRHHRHVQRRGAS